MARKARETAPSLGNSGIHRGKPGWASAVVFRCQGYQARAFVGTWTGRRATWNNMSINTRAKPHSRFGTGESLAANGLNASGWLGTEDNLSGRHE